MRLPWGKCLEYGEKSTKLASGRLAERVAKRSNEYVGADVSQPFFKLRLNHSGNIFKLSPFNRFFLALAD